MCGIFGLITRGVPIDAAACHAATQTLAHRGPDGSGTLLARTSDRATSYSLNVGADELRPLAGADVFLGHRRLSIIDLTLDAFQPMSNEDGTVWVVYNGEIYNHAALREELIALGHTFRTHHSDTETLVHGYEQWGEALVDHLRGMFALGVIDLKRRCLFLARDPFGEKPLYYSVSPRGVAFASEPKAILVSGAAAPIISRRALADYLALGYVPAPASIYRDIRKLRAAERISIDLNRPDRAKAERYWELRYAPGSHIKEGDWHREFDATLREAVELRHVSDVPVGIYLSGGLDSTMVVRSAVQISSAPPKTFNISFPNRAFDESLHAARASKHYGTDHRSLSVTPDDLRRLLPELMGIFDEPFADSSALPCLALARMAKQSVSVALSGDGGDELLGGYSRYAMNDRIGQWANRPLFHRLSQAIAPFARKWPESLRGRGVAQLVGLGDAERYEAMMSDGWLRAQSLDPTAGSLGAIPWNPAAPSLIARMCQSDTQLYLPEDLATKVDRTAMAVGLEVRAPLLDRPLFELVARAPLSFYYEHGQGKLPFREALRADLGDGFVDRPKQGFAVPLGAWFRGELLDLLRGSLESPGAFISALFPRGFARRLIDTHLRSSRDQSARLWRLLALESWHRNFGGSLE